MLQEEHLFRFQQCEIKTRNSSCNVKLKTKIYTQIRSVPSRHLIQEKALFFVVVYHVNKTDNSSLSMYNSSVKGFINFFVKSLFVIEETKLPLF